MTDISTRSTTRDNEDQSWIGNGGMPIGQPRKILLDRSLLTGTFPDGYIPSGIALGKVTATGLYGPYGASPNEVQTIDLGAATAGTITITFDGETTAAIAFNATAATVETALEALSNINPGDVTVTGGPLPGTITLTFGGQYAGTNVPEVTVTPSGLTGGTVTVATTVEGGGAVSDGREVNTGHLFATVAYDTASTGDVAAALFWSGEVIEANLPTNHGLDDAGKADVDNHIAYV